MKEKSELEPIHAWLTIKQIQPFFNKGWQSHFQGQRLSDTVSPSLGAPASNFASEIS